MQILCHTINIYEQKSQIFPEKIKKSSSVYDFAHFFPIGSIITPKYLRYFGNSLSFSNIACLDLEYANHEYFSTKNIYIV